MRIKTITSQADSCARACAIALGFTIPVAGPPLNYVMLTLLLIAWLAAGDYRGKLTAVAASPVTLAALALFALLTLGLAYGTRNPGDGARYLGKYLDLLFVPVFLTSFQDRKMRVHAIEAMGGAVILSLIVSHLTQQELLIDNPLVARIYGIPSGFKYSITHGLLAALSAFAFALCARETTHRVSRTILIGLALFAAHNVLFVVVSRTGYLVLAALMLYFFVVTLRWRGIAAATALGAALFVASYFASNVFQQRVDRAVAELSEWRAEQPSSTSVGMRMEFYRGSLEIVRENPVFGAGTGSFPAAYAATVAGKQMEPTVNPHNEYLLIASQIGLVGLTCLITLFYLQWRHAARLAPLYRDLARGLVITFAIGCLFNSLLLDHTEGLLFAWATGLLFSGLPPPSPATQRAV